MQLYKKVTHFTRQVYAMLCDVTQNIARLEKTKHEAGRDAPVNVARYYNPCDEFVSCIVYIPITESVHVHQQYTQPPISRPYLQITTILPRLSHGSPCGKKRRAIDLRFIFDLSSIRNLYKHYATGVSILFGKS